MANYGYKKKVIYVPYFQVLQTVVIQDPVIGAFAGGTLTVYRFVFFRVPWDTGMETQIAVIHFIDSVSVTAGGTILFMRARTNTFAF